MGEMADYYMEQMWDEMWYEPPDRPRRRKPFQRGTGDFRWRTKDEGVVSMWDMSQAHLANAIRICELTGNTGKQAQLQVVLDAKVRADFDEAREAIHEEGTCIGRYPPGHPMEML